MLLIEITRRVVRADQLRRHRPAFVRSIVEALRPDIRAHQGQAVPVPKVDGCLQSVVVPVPTPLLKPDSTPLRIETSRLNGARPRGRIIAPDTLLQA